MHRNLNICLHNIVEKQSDIRSIYDLTVSQLLELNDRIASRCVDSYDSYTFYFDDGYKSFGDIVCNLNLGINKENIRCAIIIDRIGTPGKLSLDEINALDAQGYGIDSHGMSHAALAVFENGKPLPTLSNGEYQNSSYGQGMALTEQEVLFQLIASKHTLESSLNKMINNFVLPFGLYNNQTIQIIAAKTNYRRILTCHSGIDRGQFLAPRLLVTQNELSNIDRLLNDIHKATSLLTDE